MNNSSDYIYWSELHCSKDALTDNYGWFMQFLLAVLAFTCLIDRDYLSQVKGFVNLDMQGDRGLFGSMILRSKDWEH
ncbi:hypothetical protein SFRURICE_000699 [Spodoptera frugiperda]|nr:hypothetical protein SFRURICE_000699 [Spodoptera frugiperda]